MEHVVRVAPFPADREPPCAGERGDMGQVHDPRLHAVDERGRAIDLAESPQRGGQSGHRGSPHYADQVDAWRRVAYHPLSFTRPAIARVQRHTLRLLPD